MPSVIAPRFFFYLLYPVGGATDFLFCRIMKKILFVAVLCLFAVSGYAQKNESSLGFQLNHTSDGGVLGLGVNARHGITEKIRGEVSFDYFFPSGGDLWNLNADAHYIFRLGETLRLYPVGGLTYWNGGGLNSGKLGLNVGGGVDLVLNDRWSLNGQFKYQVISKISQGIFRIGLSYTL